MPLSRLQSDVSRLLASQRGPDSYVAGGVAINRDGPRYSADIDIFHDGDDRLIAVAEGDAAIIRAAGDMVIAVSPDFRRRGTNDVAAPTT